MCHLQFEEVLVNRIKHLRKISVTLSAKNDILISYIQGLFFFRDYSIAYFIA